MVGFPASGVPLFNEGDSLRCDYPVNGLRLAGFYKVVRVRTEDPFYWGRCIEVRDLLTGELPVDGSAGYFPWRFSRVTLP